MSPGFETETFIALKVGIDNWRWAGVPSLPAWAEKMAGTVSGSSRSRSRRHRARCFPAGSGVGAQGPDHLTFDLADESKLSNGFYGKRPGLGMRLEKLSMQFSTQETAAIADNRLTIDPRRHAPLTTHYSRRPRHQITVGAFDTAAGGSAVGQDVSTRDVGLTPFTS